MILSILLACAREPAETAEDTSPKYYGDVQPILQQRCVRCHTEGGVAPMSLEDAETVAVLAEAIRGAVDSGKMPPPAPDPTCAPYENSDRWTLTEADREVIRAWADGGAQLGDPADATDAPAPMTTAPFDAELYGGAAYTPSFRADGNDYRCFRLDVGNATDTFLTGFEAIVDQLPEVHHVVVFDDTTRRASSSSDGFSCSGLGDDGWEFLGAWAPGATGILFPDGAGMRLAPNTTFILQMHYFGDGGASGTPDRSGFGLHLADSVDREVFAVPFGKQQFTIPAGEKHDETGKSRWTSGSGDWKVLGMWPHMHVLGDGMDMRIVHADGSEQCLVDLPGWDFHNQLVVTLLDPVDLVPGDRVDTTCFWDNREKAVNPKQFADPPQDVEWGEGSHDEMCYSFTYLMEP